MNGYGCPAFIKELVIEGYYSGRCRLETFLRFLLLVPAGGLFILLLLLRSSFD